MIFDGTIISHVLVVEINEDCRDLTQRIRKIFVHADVEDGRLFRDISGVKRQIWSDSVMNTIKSHGFTVFAKAQLSMNQQAYLNTCLMGGF